MTEPTEKRSDAPDDDVIRGAMNALRAHDERRAPPFEATWRAAEIRARAKTSRAWLVPASAGGLAAAAALVLVVSASMRSSPEAAAPASGAAPAAAASTSAARSAVSRSTPVGTEPPVLALDFLLRPPASTSFVSLTSFDRDPLGFAAGPAR